MDTSNPQHEIAPCTALLVTADVSCAVRLRLLLEGTEAVVIEQVGSFSAASKLIAVRGFDVMLIDRPSFAEACATWPDARPSGRICSRRSSCSRSATIPSEALEVLRDGAQDYLDIHGESPRRIVRCIRHAIERHRLISELREARERAQFAATHDPLTQLPNRHLFEEQMRRVLPQAQRTGASVALLYLDLDRFKGINDTLGHAAGDEVLVEVAARLAQLHARAPTSSRASAATSSCCS